MLASTLRYRSGRIHIAQHVSEFEACPERPTHATIDWEDLQFVGSFLEATRVDPITVAELRLLIARAGDGRDLSRGSDSNVIRYVAQLLAAGHLKAVTCGLQTGIPAIMISLEDTRFHIGTGPSAVIDCPYFRSHKTRVLNNPEEIRQLLENIAGDNERLRDLRRFAFGQPEFRNAPRASPHAEVLGKLGALLTSHRLSVIECSVGGSVGGIDEEEEERLRPRKRSRDQQAPAKTWIEIKLIDQDGKPVANEKYRLKLPDGSTQEGSLDENGRARYDAIDPGNCTVCFPDIDGREWKPA